MLVWVCDGEGVRGDGDLVGGSGVALETRSEVSNVGSNFLYHHTPGGREGGGGREEGGREEEGRREGGREEGGREGGKRKIVTD